MPIHLGAVATRLTGRPAEARQLYLESIQLNDELGEARMAALEHRNLAYVEIHEGEVGRARELFAECRRRLAQIDSSALAPYLAFDRASEAALDGDYTAAAAELDDAERHFREQGAVPDPDDALEMADLRRRLVTARADPPAG